MGKDQDLLEACRTGNLAAVEKHLQGRLSTRNRNSRTSAAGALSTLSKSFWNLKSANINCVDASGDTPLHLAALNGHKEIVTILLECEASPTVLDSQDCSPLHLAAWNGHTDICSQLIAASDDQAFVNLQTRDGNTAVHFAAQHGHDRTLSLLLQKKADPTIRNLEDLSALDLAAQYDRLEIVKQLVVSHPELVAQRSALNTPLHLASRNGHRAVVHYLIDAGFPLDAKTDKGTALHEAANFCKLDVIRLLLDRGIDITVKSQTGCTAEDILRSIPSKVAEDALSILKTHIYHQRTPDSDGERGIIADAQLETSVREVMQGTPPSIKALASGPAPSPTERKNYLYKSLPSGQDSAPPPIPPRQSVRAPDLGDTSSTSSFSEKGLAPIKVAPVQTDRDNSSDEDKNKLSPREASPSPREVSPTTRDVSPSSSAARSPTDQPKKPPRKKPLSFRRPEQGPHIPGEASSGGGNYVNLDPSVERALLDARASTEIENTGQEGLATTTSTNSAAPTTTNTAVPNCTNTAAPTSTSTAAPTSTSTAVPNSTSGNSPALPVTAENIIDRTENIGRPVMAEKISDKTVNIGDRTVTTEVVSDSPALSVTAEDNNNRTHKQTHEHTETDNSVIKLSQIAAPDLSAVVDETKVSDAEGMKPPSSLDIGHSEEKLDQIVKSPSHRQPPTPDCPPPSPGTAIQNIHSRIQPMEKRKSRDIETITDSSITGQDNQSSPSPVVSDDDVLNPPSLTSVKDELSAVASRSPHLPAHCKKKPTPLPRKSSLSSETRDLYPADNSSPTIVSGNSNQDTDLRLTSKDKTEELSTRASVEEANTVEVEGEIVLMRRSLSSSSEATDWEGHAFAGLLRGSVIGPARDVVHQLGGTNTVSAADFSRKKQRKSTLSTFAPLMEEDKDIDPDKVMGEIDNITFVQQQSGMKKSEDNVFDDSEDWAQISATFETFGVGISRESVFVREHEANFAKFLTQGSPGENKIQSIGEWLSDTGLAQYENMLVANGFDDTDFLGGNILEEQDLQAIGVENPNHRMTIIEAASRLATLKPIDASNPPTTVAEWLSSLRLEYYYDTFLSHKYDSMDRVVKLWELELVTVLDITSVGHRKRILASLGERPLEAAAASATRTRVPSLEGLSNPKSPFEHVDLYRDYTGVKSRVTGLASDSDMGHGTFVDYDQSDHGSSVQGHGIRDSSLHIRAPHLIHYTGAIKQWRHSPEILIKGCCNYTAHYLGSTQVKELKGAMSTQEGIAKLKKSSEVISKIPTIMLSISFKGVKFIDASSKKVVCDHEIANIFCACQDGEHMNFFAYITKDREADKHYCHVFSVRSKELAGEIILTLGEAFEIAYQMVLKERAERAAEEFDKLSASDGDDTTSVSSKTSIHTI